MQLEKKKKKKFWIPWGMCGSVKNKLMSNQDNNEGRFNKQMQ